MKKNIFIFCKALVFILGMLFFCKCQNEGGGIARLDSSLSCISGSATGITAGITGQRICDDRIDSSSSLKSTSYNTRRSRDSLWKVSGGAYYTPTSSPSSPAPRQPSGPRVPVTNICSRTQQVREALLRETSAPNCQSVPTAELNNMQSLDMSGSYVTGVNSHPCDDYKIQFKLGDFADLTGLTELILSDNCLAQQNPTRQYLPSGIFDPLVSIETINLSDTGIATFCDMPPDLFTNILSTLQRIKVTSFCYCATSDYHSKLRDGNGFSINSGCCQIYCP